MTTLTLTSDLHGHLPEMPPSDIAVIAGDVMTKQWSMNPMPPRLLAKQVEWLKGRFIPWVESIPSPHVVMTWGNHDHIGEWPGLWPEWPKKLHVLVDRGVTLDGLRFWGLPWTNRFHDWAFNADPVYMTHKVSMIPDDTDIIVSHGPPFGYGDSCGRLQLGSHALADRITAIEPSLVVCGHIHSGFGSYTLNGTPIMNVSHVNEAYKPAHAPRVVQVSVCRRDSATPLDSPAGACDNGSRPEAASQKGHE